MRNIGAKFFPNGKTFYHSIKKNADFLEIMATEGEKYEFLERYDKLVVIHMEHDYFGINFANPDKRKKNAKAVEWAVKLADKYHAKKIIVHGGYIENRDCSHEEVVQQLKKVWDSRMIFENLIYIYNQMYMYPYSKEHLKKLTTFFHTGICLDISHAVISARELQKKPEQLLKELATLPICHIHLCDGFLEIPCDMHLHVSDGNFPLKQYLHLLPKNVDITLETGKNIQKWKKDLAFVRKYS